MKGSLVSRAELSFYGVLRLVVGDRMVICAQLKLDNIELDDASHQKVNRQERDITVEGIFEAAGLPIVRIPVRASY